jgi:hypothetical protein
MAPYVRSPAAGTSKINASQNYGNFQLQVPHIVGGCTVCFEFLYGVSSFLGRIVLAGAYHHLDPVNRHTIWYRDTCILVEFSTNLKRYGAM